MGWTGHTQSGFLTPLAQPWKYLSDVFVDGLSPLVVLVSYLLTNSKLSPGFLTQKNRYTDLLNIFLKSLLLL